MGEEGEGVGLPGTSKIKQESTDLNETLAVGWPVTPPAGSADPTLEV